MIAAECLFKALVKDNLNLTAAAVEKGEEILENTNSSPILLDEYEPALRESWVGRELYAVRNTHAAFHYGTWAGLIHTFVSW